MKNLALRRIQRLTPYQPPLDGRSVYRGLLLDFNERTTRPSRAVQQALQVVLKSGSFQVYPEYFDLEKKIAAYAGVSPDQVLITNGSDQAIDVIFRTFTERGSRVIIPRPSFAFFTQCARVNGATILRPMYRKSDVAFPLAEVFAALDRRVRLVVICNPNNPTGTAVAAADIATIARRAPQAVIYVDEAYFEFCKISAVPLIKRYPNIVVTRTFSKAFGLAALRLGYIIARKEYIAELRKVRGPYDVNTVARSAARAALSDRKSMERYVAEVMQRAKPMVEKFFLQSRIPYFASAANFILWRPREPRQTQRALQAAGVLVRSQRQAPVADTLRVSIGTRSQMRRFIRIYRQVVPPAPPKYALLDRDGTLIFEPTATRQIDSLKKFKILPGVITGLQELQRLGYRLIMVSNQDGIGTPAFPRKKFLVPQRRLLVMLRRQGITFAYVGICPHLPDASCVCRKPKTGLVDAFLRATPYDRAASLMCGDRPTDRQFAKNVGIRFVPIPTNGNFSAALQSFFNTNL